MKANGAKGQTLERSFDLLVPDLNEAPFDLTFDALVLNENSGPFSLVGFIARRM